MPTYKVTDPSTGKTIRLTGDSPPTEQELNDIFSQVGGQAKTEPQQTAQGKSVRGFVVNAAKDIPEIAKGIFGLVTNNGEPILSDKGPIMGLVNTVKGGGQAVLGSYFPNAFPEYARMDTPAIRQAMETYAPVGESILNPSGIPSRMLDYGYEHPLQAAMNLSAGAGMLGKVAEVGNLARTASVLGKVSDVTNPINAAVNGPMSIVQKVGRSMAPSLYESAMKIPPSVGKGVRDAAVKTGLEGRYPVTEGGLNKLRSNIDVLNKEIDNVISTGAKGGKTVDMMSVVSRIDDLKDFYKDYPRAKKYLADLDAIQTEILKTNDLTIPVNQAQKMKQRIYQINRKHYGDMKSVDVEADKAVARGLKEEIVKQHPELKVLNAKDSSLISFEEFLERAVNRSRNYDVIRMGDAIMSVGGSVVGGPGGALTAGVTRHIFESPGFKSRLAILLNKARRMNPSVGHAGNVVYQVGKRGLVAGEETQNPIAENR